MVFSVSRNSPDNRNAVVRSGNVRWNVFKYTPRSQMKSARSDRSGSERRDTYFGEISTDRYDSPFE